MRFRTPGSWLYRGATLEWLSDPELVRQLPRLYRVFAHYCAACGNRPPGAEILLRVIIALKRPVLPGDGISPLRIADLTLFLDLLDPRFLRVPRDLAGLPQILKRYLRPGDTFIDGGANHGAFSIVAARLVGPAGLVIPIEPQPRLALLLRQLLAQGPSPFEVHQLACGAGSREAGFYIPRATSGSAGLFPGFSARSRHSVIQVAMRRMDDIIDWRRLPGRTFIKLDVEGSELAVLLGARELIRATAPALLIEINPDAMRAAGSSKAALVRELLNLGYNRFVMPHEPERKRPLTGEIPDRDLIVLPASGDK